MAAPANAFGAQQAASQTVTVPECRQIRGIDARATTKARLVVRRRAGITDRVNLMLTG